MYFVSQETAVKLELDKLISKYRSERLYMMKERREYKTDHGHNWCINIYKGIEKDLKELKTQICGEESRRLKEDCSADLSTKGKAEPDIEPSSRSLFPTTQIHGEANREEK